jgi:hypothetical protein
MRFALRILGTEVLSVELDGASDDDTDESGPERSFGFHGGSGGHAERADEYEELPGVTAPGPANP